jgi:hypothetical protein
VNPGAARAPAMRMGTLLFSLAMAGLGLLNIRFADFALQWQPVPDWVPLRQATAVPARHGGVILMPLPCMPWIRR